MLKSFIKFVGVNFTYFKSYGATSTRNVGKFHTPIFLGETKQITPEIDLRFRWANISQVDKTFYLQSMFSIIILAIWWLNLATFDCF